MPGRDASQQVPVRNDHEVTPGAGDAVAPLDDGDVTQQAAEVGGGRRGVGWDAGRHDRAVTWRPDRAESARVGDPTVLGDSLVGGVRRQQQLHARDRGGNLPGRW